MARAGRLTSIGLFTTDDGGTVAAPHVYLKRVIIGAYYRIHIFFFHGEEFNIARYRSRRFGGER